jgi:hypothetical protein
MGAVLGNHCNIAFAGCAQAINEVAQAPEQPRDVQVLP